MNKNVIIGVLVTGIVLIGGYALLKSNPQNVVPTTNTNTQTTPTPSPSTPKPSPTLTPRAPKVETSQNFNASSSAVLLTGQVTPNGVPTTYWFEYGEGTGLGSKGLTQTIGSGYSPIFSPSYITGLRANTSYSYRLAAKNSFGTVSGSTYVFKTNNDPAPERATPSVSTKSATSITRTSADINGQVDPNGWRTTYWFEYGEDPNFGTVTSTILIEDELTSTSTISARISDLDPLTKYYFRLNAQNQFGTVNGSTSSFTTKGPLNPGAPTVTTTSASNITKEGARLNGSVNPNGADTTYWFEYSEDSLLGNIIGEGTTVQSLNASTSTINVQADIGNLATNTKYFYRLIARNQHNTVKGAILSFTTRP